MQREEREDLHVCRAEHGRHARAHPQVQEPVAMQPVRHATTAACASSLVCWANTVSRTVSSSEKERTY